MSLLRGHRGADPAPRGTGWWCGALVLALTFFAPRAEAVQVTTGAGSGVAGQTVDITLSTGNLTGLNIYSLQFDLTYNAGLISATDVIEASTAVGNAGWGDATFNVISGKLLVAAAGTTALSGSGALIKIRFLINPAQLAATSSTLTLSNFVFNEGAPNDTTSNNTLTINAMPIITVSPNTAEIVRGGTQQFSVSGSVSNPVSWFTTDGAIATISATGLLTGVAPGAVRVYAVDNAGLRDTTNADILIRGMSLTVGATTVTTGQQATVPITVSSLNGLGIRAGQVTLTYNPSLLTPSALSMLPGTLLNGWGTAGLGSGSNGSVTFAFAGSSDLTGSGTLCHIIFNTTSSGTSAVTPTVALFNETLPAKTTGANVTVSALPTITVNPDNVTLLAGQTQQMTLTGSPTAPIQWSTLDAAVATINDATGLLTAVGGGVTQVRAIDAVGATDLNQTVTVYDFKTTVTTVTGVPGSTVRVPLKVDRNISGLDIRSLQYTATFNATYIQAARAYGAGLVSIWGTSPTTNLQSGSLTVAEAGSAPLGGGTDELQELEFDIKPSAPAPIDVPVTLLGLTFNQGHPSSQVVNGIIRIRSTTAVAAAPAAAFALAPPWPNPARGVVRFAFSVPDPHVAATLSIVGVDGRRVRTLAATRGDADGEARWDGADESGRAVEPGVYYAALEWRGQRLTRRFALLR